MKEGEKLDVWDKQVCNAFTISLVITDPATEHCLIKVKVFKLIGKFPKFYKKHQSG